MGNPGKDRTIGLLRDRFFWTGMNVGTENWIKNCNRCLRRKSTCQRAPLINITSSYALELVCLDYLTLEPCKGGINNILVITDHYTRFAMAIPTKNQTAKTTGRIPLQQLIIHYGLTVRLHSDQGVQFESNIIKELCEITKMEKSRTTPYHPMSNGMTERFNRTLLNMLGTLENSEKQNWKNTYHLQFTHTIAQDMRALDIHLMK